VLYSDYSDSVRDLSAAQRAQLKTAIKWLKKHNPLFADHLALCETLHGYYDSTSNEGLPAGKPAVATNSDCLDLSAATNAKRTGSNREGLLFPVDDYSSECHERELPLSDISAGIVHPRSDGKNSILYGDDHLEAKIFVHLLPDGEVRSFIFRC